MNNEILNKELKYVLYARRSIVATQSEEDKGVPSIDSQKLEVRELAAEKGITIVKEFSETMSASKPYQRPKFTEMMEFIEAGKANAIICFKMDRLTRNPIDEGLLKHYLETEVIKNIKSTDRDWYPDDNSLLSSIEFAMARQYSRDLKKHIRRGQRDSLRRGFRPTLAPVGYMNTRYREKGKLETCEPDPETWPIIKKLFDTVLSRQYTPHQVFEIATKQWGLRARKTTRYAKGRPLSIHSFYNILNNPFYYGEFQWPLSKGDWYKGSHKPMITRAQYDEIQGILGRGNAKNQLHEHAYTGLLRCICGARITCEKKFKTQKNGNKHVYSYYHCTGHVRPCKGQKSIRVEKLEELIVEYLSSLRIAPAFHQWALTELRNEFERESGDKTNILYTQRKALALIERKLENLFEMRMNGEIDTDLYKENREANEEESRRLKGEIEAIEQRFKTWIDDAERLLTFSERAEEEFLNGGLQKRRAIVSALGSEHLLDQGVLTIKAEKPLLLMREMASAENFPESSLEPAKDKGIKGPEDFSDPEFSRRWRCGELNSGPNPALRASLRRVANVEGSAEA